MHRRWFAWASFKNNSQKNVTWREPHSDSSQQQWDGRPFMTKNKLMHRLHENQNPGVERPYSHASFECVS